MAKLFGKELRGVGVDRVGDLGHMALLHHQLDDVDAALRHAVREFLDRDGLGDGDFARELLLVLVVAMAGHALRAAAERGDRTLTHFIGGQRGDEREAAALLRRAGARPMPRRAGRRSSSSASGVNVRETGVAAVIVLALAASSSPPKRFLATSSALRLVSSS